MKQCFFVLIVLLGYFADAQTDTIKTFEEETVITVLDPSTGEAYKDYFEQKKMMIAGYEGFPASPFIGEDLDGEEHRLAYYRGRILILFFWNSFSEACLSQIKSLNHIQETYNSDLLTILSFADDDASSLRSYIDRYMKDNAPQFPIIPNSRKFADEAFGKGLQYPRIFVIDKDGLIRKVKSNADVYDPMEVYKELKPILDDLLKE